MNTGSLSLLSQNIVQLLSGIALTNYAHTRTLLIANDIVTLNGLIAQLSHDSLKRLPYFGRRLTIYSSDIAVRYKRKTLSEHRAA
jgi:hypothetical protein